MLTEHGSDDLSGIKNKIDVGLNDVKLLDGRMKYKYQRTDKMNNKMSKICVYFKDRQTVEKECEVWANKIVKSYKPDLIVFLAKSGFLFANVIGRVCDCPVVDISISRPNNKEMDLIKKIVPFVPRVVLASYLQMKVTRDGYDEESERYVIDNNRFEMLDINQFSSILILDDSVDTGWSMKKCISLIESRGYKGEYKVASFCVLNQALERVNVDFSMYVDSIVVTATSRYSREYNKFISDYEKWKNSYI